MTTTTRVGIADGRSRSGATFRTVSGLLLAATAWMGWSVCALAQQQSPDEDTMTCSGVVTGSDDKPLAGVAVAVRGIGSATTSADGHYSISGPRQATLYFTAGKPGVGSIEQVKICGDTKAVDWSPGIGRPGVIEGRLLDENGAPLADWPICIVRDPQWAERGSGWYGRTDADGAIVARVSNEYNYRVFTGPKGSNSHVCVDGPVSTGVRNLRWTMSAEMKPVTAVKFTVSLPDEVRRESLYAVLLTQSHGRGAATIKTPRDECVMGPVAIGTYVIDVQSEVGHYEFGPVVVDSPGVLDLGDLACDDPGLLALDSRRTGEKFGKIQYRIWRSSLCGEDGWVAGSLGALRPGGELIELRRAPGRYRVLFYGTGVTDSSCEVVVRSNERSVCRAQPRAGGVRWVEIEFPEPPPAFRMRLTASDGAVTECDPRFSSRTSIRVAPGTYRVDVETSRHRRLSGHLVVPSADTGETLRVRVE